jgi:shikimate kinase
MAVIAMFYGIIVSMYYFDNRQHHLPHLHVRYQEQEVVVSIPDGEVLEGRLKRNKLKLVQAWIEIHQEELMADWQLAIQGQPIFRIEALR